MTDDAAPDRGPIEIRTAPVVGVDYPDRTITLLAVPYNQTTVVEYRGRLIEESFAPGAFGAIRNRARKFLVNMEHDEQRWVGTVLDLDAANEKGLRSIVRIRRTPEGDQALTDAADGLLGASVGFAAADRDIEWLNRDSRRVRKAFLGHIALTATPAYVGADVEDVRSLRPVVVPPVTSATPLLDRVLAERSRLGY